MLDRGFPLRCLLLWAAWTSTVAAGVAWAVFRESAIAEGGIVLLTLACTLNILNDNARTRRVVRAAVCDATEPPPGPNHLSSVS